MRLEIGDIEADTLTNIEPSLKMNLIIRNDGKNRVVLTSISGIIKIMNRNVESIPIGFLDRRINSGGWYKDAHVHLLLDTKRLHEIEKLRKKGDVKIGVSLSVQYKDEGNYNETLWGEKELSQKKWIDLLSKLGYGNRRLFEIANPTIFESQPIETGIRLIKAAHSLLLEGQHEAAFSKCRLALEGIYPSFNKGPVANQIKFDNDIINTGSSHKFVQKFGQFQSTQAM